jgi:nucleoside-diphosphate-sugar epimerase
LKVKEIVNYGKKIFKSKSKIILKKKKYYESENLSLDSSKSLKLLRWQTKFNDMEALKMTFDWYRKFYKVKNVKKIIDLSFDQIKQFKLKHKL